MSVCSILKQSTDSQSKADVTGGRYAWLPDQ